VHVCIHIDDSTTSRPANRPVCICMCAYMYTYRRFAVNRSVCICMCAYMYAYRRFDDIDGLQIDLYASMCVHVYMRIDEVCFVRNRPLDSHIYIYYFVIVPLCSPQASTLAARVWAFSPSSLRHVCYPLWRCWDVASRCSCVAV